VNKIDLPQVSARMEEIRGAFNSISTSVIFISAETGEGVPQLMEETMRMLGMVGETGKRVSRKVFRPQPRAEGVRVEREEGTFVVVAPELERIIARVDMSDPQVRWQLDNQLTRLGVRRALERAGIKAGDRVRCGDSEWEW
jgi:GTP-binding protein